MSAPSRFRLPFFRLSPTTLTTAVIGATFLFGSAVPAAAWSAPPPASAPAGPLAAPPQDLRQPTTTTAARRQERRRPLARSKPIPRRLARQLERALDRARRAFGYNSVEFALRTSSGRTYAARSGPRPRTPFVIGSVTKTFVAALTLHLAERGKLRLNAPASRYLSGVAARRARGVTVRQLLSHRSGISDLYNGRVQRLLRRHRGMTIGPRQVLHTVRSGAFRPGRGYAYSNTNYLLLGMIIENVTGNRLERVIERRYLRRLHMTHSSMIDGRHRSPRLSQALATAFWASGNMTSTASDLTRWGQALYGRRLLSRRSMDNMLDIGSSGYGLGTQRLWVGRRAFAGHSGLLGTDTTVLIWVPRQRLAVAVIVNRPSSQVDDLLAYRWRGRPSLLELARRVD